MKQVGWLLAAVAAVGCTIQVTPPGPAASAKPGGTPAPAATASPKATPKPTSRPSGPPAPFRGAWTPGTGPDVKGPVELDPCEPFLRFAFVPDPGGGATRVEVKNANQAPTRAYYSESLTVLPGDGPDRWRLEGVVITPGPTDGPVETPVLYDLTFDAAGHRLVGTKQHGKGPSQPFNLVETTAAGACVSPAPTPTAGPSAAADAPVVTVAYSGGLCPTAECGGSTTYRIDGSWTARSGGKPAGEGRVPVDLVAAVARQLTRTDYDAIRAKPFTGTCPTAYDGPEITYTFHLPGGSDEVLRSCESDLPADAPLFEAVAALEAARNGN